jgi:hypothetical protein
VGYRHFDRHYHQSKGYSIDPFGRRTMPTLFKDGRALPHGNDAPEPPMGNSAVTGKINRGSHFPDCEENTSMIRRVNDGEGIPAPIGRRFQAMQGTSKPSENGEYLARSHSLNSRVGGSKFFVPTI